MSDDTTGTPENSLLTPLYREYLENKPTKGDNQTTLRTRMRKRTIQGLQDIALLSQYARSDDIKQIFDRKSLDERTNGNYSLPDGPNMEFGTNFVLGMHMVALAWWGLRENDVDKRELFEKMVVWGIEYGEAKHKDVDMSRVESELPYGKVQAHTDVSGMDPLEKWERGIGLTSEDIGELHDRVSDHPDVNETLGKDLNELIETYLLEE